MRGVIAAHNDTGGAVIEVDLPTAPDEPAGDG